MAEILTCIRRGENLFKINGNILDRLKDTFSALRHRNFRYFWCGQCISLMGTWMQRTAQAWLVYQLTNSPFLLGILGVFQFGPVLLFSLFAGVYVDRFPKKKILLFTQSLFTVQALLLTILVWTGTVQYWHILILAAVFGFGQSIDMPARQSFFIELVGKEDLMNAISLNSSIVNLAKIVGPAAAGVAMVKMGATFCFFLNTVSFIPVIYGLYLIDVEGKVKIREKGNVLTNIKQGLIYIRKNYDLMTTVLIMAVVCTFSMNTDIIIPVFAKDVLHKGPHEYSLLLSAMGAGSFIGAMLMAGRSKRGLKRAILFIDAFMVSIVQIIASFSGYLIPSMIGVALIGFFNMTFLNMGNSTMQLSSNDEYRGRVMSVYTIVVSGTTPVGNFYAGTVMEHMGANMGFFMCGVATLIPAVILLIVKRNFIKEGRQVIM